MQWATGFDVCCFLDSNDYQDRLGDYDFMLAAGANNALNADAGNAFEQLKEFYQKQWLFGFFSYDLKAETEHLPSHQPDDLHFPALYFFIPQFLIVAKNGQLAVYLGNPAIIDEIEQLEPLKPQQMPTVCIQPRLNKSQYLAKIEALKKHISRGDIYEVNFCQEFFAEAASINPLQTFQQLKDLSPTPFSGFFKLNQQYILSATPERFLRKKGNQLISQPIKGTAKRSINPLDDEKIKLNLKNDVKERAENIMIVDLVRHDLTQSAVKGTVKVDELCGIYSFPQVHQMISTVSCALNPNIHFIEAIKNTFPMGSMTGAPKVRAMQLIERYETRKRGMFSGSFGYINPTGDFDFNVVIRSILYHAQHKYLSFQVGSAITFESDPEKEYEECLLKASAILKVLQQK